MTYFHTNDINGAVTHGLETGFEQHRSSGVLNPSVFVAVCPKPAASEYVERRRG